MAGEQRPLPTVVRGLGEGGGAWRHVDLVVVPEMAGEQSTPSAADKMGSATLAFPIQQLRGGSVKGQPRVRGGGQREAKVGPKPAEASPRPSRSRRTPLGGGGARESSLGPGFTLCQKGEVRMVHTPWVSRDMPSSGAHPRSDAVRRG